MIIFSSIELEKALADQKVTRWQKAKYIIIPAIFLSIVFPTAAFFRPRFEEIPGTLYSLVQFICMITSIFITYFGIKSCFKINENIDERNFIERLCILVIPILFKLFFIFLPVAFLGMIILTATKSHPEIHEHVSLLFLAFGPIYLLIFFSFLKHSFLRFSDLITDNSSQPLAQADRKG